MENKLKNSKPIFAYILNQNGGRPSIGILLWVTTFKLRYANIGAEIKEIVVARSTINRIDETNKPINSKEPIITKTSQIRFITFVSIFNLGNKILVAGVNTLE